MECQGSPVLVSASCHGDSHLSRTSLFPVSIGGSGFRLLSRRFVHLSRPRCHSSCNWRCCVSASCHGDSHLSLGSGASTRDPGIMVSASCHGDSSPQPPTLKITIYHDGKLCFRLLSRRFTPQPDRLPTVSTTAHGTFPPPVTEIHTSAGTAR